MKMRNANWIGHILRRYGVLKYVVEVMTEVTRRRGRRRERLRGDLKKLIAGIRKKKQQIAIFVELDVEEAVNLVARHYEMHA